tara:strand:- start:5118 stop:6218 length:1101 start_codon:yes stop_codon:yes gene_type:complete
MIVRDEADVIERAFDSVINFVDYYIICDTGSVDGTQQVIKDYWERNNLKGELHEHEWVNYGRNRTLCFDLAKGKSDYIMTLDADEVIAPFKNQNANIYSKIVELPELSGDAIFSTTVLGTNHYPRQQFFRNGVDWYWTEPVHETCVADESITYTRLQDLCCFASSQKGGRVHDTSTYLKDAAMLEEHLLSNPQDSRAHFYLAQSYGDAGDIEKALAASEKALEVLEWDQEIYQILLRRARWTYLKTEDLSQFTTDCLEVYSEMPTRAEPLFDLVRAYSRIGYYPLALMFGEAALKCAYPSPDCLFVESDIYTWKLKDLVAVAYFYMGDYDHALPLFQELKDNPAVPEDQRARINNNITECTSISSV